MTGVPPLKLYPNSEFLGLFTRGVLVSKKALSDVLAFLRGEFWLPKELFLNLFACLRGVFWIPKGPSDSLAVHDFLVLRLYYH